MNKKEKEKLEQIIDLVQRGKWLYAKTCPEIPHEYLLKKDLDEKDKILFVEFVDFIRKHGYKKKFNGSQFTYFLIGTNVYRSWWYYSEKIPLINRATNPDCK